MLKFKIILKNSNLECRYVGMFRIVSADFSAGQKNNLWLRFRGSLKKQKLYFEPLVLASLQCYCRNKMDIKCRLIYKRLFQRKQ